MGRWPCDQKWDARVDHILKALGVDADEERIRPNPENMQYIIDSIPTKELLARLANEAEGIYFPEDDPDKW